MTQVAVRRLASSDAVVLALSGELDLGRAAETETAVRVAASRGRTVIVDLAAVEFLDCAALGSLLKARKVARDAGGDVLLASPRRPLVRRLLALTGLAGTPVVLTEENLGVPHLAGHLSPHEEGKLGVPVTLRTAGTPSTFARSAGSACGA